MSRREDTRFWYMNQRVALGEEGFFRIPAYYILASPSYTPFRDLLSTPRLSHHSVLYTTPNTLHHRRHLFIDPTRSHHRDGGEAEQRGRRVWQVERSLTPQSRL